MKYLSLIGLIVISLIALLMGIVGLITPDFIMLGLGLLVLSLALGVIVGIKQWL